MSGYSGNVEYAHSSYAKLEIDDLDRPDWVGVLSGVVLLRGNAPDEWVVGVVLLDSPRAGASATATFVAKHTDDAGASVPRFEGLTVFGADADPATAAEAQQRYDAMQAQVEQLKRRFERSADADPGAPEFQPRADEPASLSVLDRPRGPRDLLPPHMVHGPARFPIRDETVRLALEHAGHAIYVAQGVDGDSLFLIHSSPGGDGASGGPMSNITHRGGMVASSESVDHRIIYGIIPDAVTAVRSHERDAVMGENVFVLDADHATMADLTLVTAMREYSVNHRPPNELSPPPA